MPGDGRGISRSQADRLYASLEDMNKIKTIAERQALEGKGPSTVPTTALSYGTRQTKTAGQLSFDSTSTIPLGRCYFVAAVSGGLDKAGQIAFRLGNSTRSNYSSLSTAGYVVVGNAAGDAGGVATIPFGDGLYIPSQSEVQVGYICSDTAAGATNAPRFSGALAVSADLTADLNWDAAHLAMFGSDSTGWTIPGSVGTANADDEDLYPVTLTCDLRGLGADVRHVNKGFGGATIAQMAQKAQEGFFDLRAGLFVINAGLNDVTNVVPVEATVKANYRIILDHYFRKNPNGSVVACGSVTTTDPARLYGVPVRSSNLVATSATTATLDAGASAVDGAYVGYVIGAGGVQSSAITNYVGATKVATFANWSGTTPSGTAAYSIYNAPAYASETTIAMVRRWISEVVAEPAYSTRSIFYVSLTEAYSAAQIATYTGDGNVHPNIAGMAQITAVLKPAIAQTRFFQQDLRLGESWT